MIHSNMASEMDEDKVTPPEESSSSEVDIVKGSDSPEPVAESNPSQDEPVSVENVTVTCDDSAAAENSGSAENVTVTCDDSAAAENSGSAENVTVTYDDSAAAENSGSAENLPTEAESAEETPLPEVSAPPENIEIPEENSSNVDESGVVEEKGEADSECTTDESQKSSDASSVESKEFKPEDAKESVSNKKSSAPRGKGYQESRKLDRDKREERRRNERKMKAEEGETVAGNSKDSNGASESKEIQEEQTSSENNSAKIESQLMDMLQKSSTPAKVAPKETKRPKGKPPKTTPSPSVKGKSAADLEAKWQTEEDLKRQKEKEDEEKRLAEEAKKEEEERRLEEEKRLKEEEAERLKQEEINSLKDFITETQERLDFKSKLREENLAATENRSEDVLSGKLDSSLKKNTSFVKKLRNMTEGQRETLLKDLKGLNLSKYIGEAAAAITDAKLKMSDINTALLICSALHQRYMDFSSALMDNWLKVLPNKKDDKPVNASKLRVDLRFFAELVAIGVFVQKEGLGVLANQLTLLVNNDPDGHPNLSIILSFCRHCGDDYAGIVPRKYRLLNEKYGMNIPVSKMLPAERQKACRNLLKDYYSSVSKYLVQEHRQLKDLEKQHRKMFQTKGELSSERLTKQETAQNAFAKLHGNVQSLADLLDEDLPEFPKEATKTVTADSISADFYSPMKGSEFEYDGDTSLFEDDESRQFYETLPDLKAIIPGILYKDSVQSEKQSLGENQEELQVDDDLNVEDMEKELMEEDLEEESEGAASSTKEETPEALAVETPADEEMDTSGNMKQLLDSFLNGLQNCVNRELIDKAAINFCMNLNTKSNRKKLTKALFGVHRTRYDLLPFYSRLVAVLTPCMPDLATDLGGMLMSDFKWHVRKKDQINIESKLKTVRFIGELVKFKLFPKSEALHCIKMLLHDFTHHNIEMACGLLETCGRFLYRSQESHHRTKVYLEVMMRKKSALHLDSRYTTMIENAFYYSNPPEVKVEARQERPPMHQYIRKLLYKDLNKITVEKVLRQMRKLDWSDPEIAAYAARCLTGVWNIRYSAIHCCANLLAGLAPYHEPEAISVLDAVLEDIRLGMEINLPKYNQRRISMVKYLGELYNYRMVESTVIFKTLYSFITFGITLDDSSPSVLDPPECLFRVRLVCTLLDTCGQYFDRGSSKKKLDCFLTYFQRYYWYKKQSSVWTDVRPFPIELDYLMADIIEHLRPKLILFTSYAEACDAAAELDKQFRAKLELLKPSEESDEGGLPPIQEIEDDEGGADDLLDRGLSQAHTGGTQDSQEAQDVNHSGSQSLTLKTGDPDFSEGEENGREELGNSLDSAGEDEEEDDDEEEEEGEEEDMPVLAAGPKLIKCQEDDDFMATFDKMMSETIQARSQEAMKVPQVDIPVPSSLRGQHQRQQPPPHPQALVSLMGAAAPEEEQTHAEEKHDEVDSTVRFTLMIKKGHKPQLSSLNIPLSAGFASKFKERTKAEQLEKERMKRMTLDIHERQEEEDYQEMLASMNRPVAPNVNRERRVRYQHPKGAPDADLIFGSKKR